MLCAGLLVAVGFILQLGGLVQCHDTGPRADNCEHMSSNASLASRGLAVCITGQSRSFKRGIVRDRIAHLFREVSQLAGEDVKLFFNIEVPDNVSVAVTILMVEQLAPAWSSINMPAKAYPELNNKCSDMATPTLTRTLLRSSTEIGGIVYKPTSPEVIIQRWMQVSAKLADCFDAVEAYEQNTGRRFAYVARFRPDLLVLHAAKELTAESLRGVLATGIGRGKRCGTCFVPAGRLNTR